MDIKKQTWKHKLTEDNFQSYTSSWFLKLKSSHQFKLGRAHPYIHAQCLYACGY